MSQKKIVFKIMKPGNKGFVKYVVKAPAGKLFTPKGVEQAITMAAEHIERMLPNQNYRFMPTRDGYTFVWESENANEPESSEVASS